MNRSLTVAKNLGVQHNVCIRVIDEPSGKVVSEHVGHNAATNTLLTGIGQFLMGGSVTGAGELLADWIPQYISLGTMGLRNQDEEENGLPAGVGDGDFDTEEALFTDYMSKAPGFGSDGYDESLRNGRAYFGLGPVFANRPYSDRTVECELISASFPRSKITYRRCFPESQSEIPKTIDVVFSALVSTGALAQFRESGRNYIFISEVGLWSRPSWSDGKSNGLLAGYRLCPPDRSNWDMSDPINRRILKENIIRVGINQVVQVIWKIQLGAVEQIGDINSQFPEWHIVI